MRLAIIGIWGWAGRGHQHMITHFLFLDMGKNKRCHRFEAAGPLLPISTRASPIIRHVCLDHGPA